MKYIKAFWPIFVSALLLISFVGISWFSGVSPFFLGLITVVGVALIAILTRLLIQNYFLTYMNDSLSTELDTMHNMNEELFVGNLKASEQGTVQDDKSEKRFKDVSQNSKTSLKDVAGCSEAKEEVIEIIDFLKNPDKYHQAGAKLPRGILFEGPPGTGKTLLAKAIAGEAKVKFLATSGAEFMEMYVGKGAQRIRELFEEASKEPTLVFIDEIDAIGGKRGTSAGNDSERERTLNQLLVEMDGFNEKKDIVVIAATNRKDMLDSALLRPGRFERHITIGLPTTSERLEILKVHAKNKHFDKDVNLESLAKKTSHFSGAMLSSLLNEAALMSVRRRSNNISMSDCEEALDRVILGPAKKSRQYIEQEKKLVAYHEAGHAVIGLKLASSRQIERITIIPRGDAGGYNLFSDKEDTFFSTKKMILEEITGYLGGRAAEEIIFNDISSGAHNDLQNATRLAKSFVCEYGMSELGMIQFSQMDTLSDSMKKAVDDQINNIIKSCYQRAKDLLINNKDLLESIAKTLIEKETIDASEVQQLAEAL